MRKPVIFEIRDLVSRELLAQIQGKAEADREFVRLQNALPNRRLWLKQQSK